ncbi:protein-export chaperone SecB [Alkalilimnicola ehrlichii]|uniref:Protein-export protein SecB n=1 Tax=Alkalilimnicola ehrlichii TaxID=351052 RepID=A0A3E0WYZ8_9GAMM|nr:protein-export chaperone SecB [Alkalilimnicola ehrlichii]RFA30669.1 protein-export chaperone SecB [Alkalilimnicola ehrlichii]RFA38248.1 protein-export chaperone SecB [Alkalilimnicola ehrlichii]
MAENNGAGQATNQQGAAGQQFNLGKIFLKDVSFETPNSPEVFQTGEWKPEVNVDLDSNARGIAEKTYEVVVRVTVTTKQAGKTAYLCEIQQGGIFQIDGFDEPTLKALLGGYCPNILFPYAREAVSDIITKGGFPQMLLGPVNFDALYQQRLAQEKQQQQAN